MSNSNNTTNRRRFTLASDITFRGIITDAKVMTGSSIKNAANFGLATVDILNAWLPVLRNLGYTSVEFGEVLNKAARTTVFELNMLVKEWHEDSNIPEEIRDFDVPMEELVKKAWTSRKKKEAEEKASDLLITNMVKEIEGMDDISAPVKEQLLSFIRNLPKTNAEELSALFKTLVEQAKKVGDSK